MAQKKYYVVWQGRTPGVYTSWDAAEAQVCGFQGARYKSFTDEFTAQEAFDFGPDFEVPEAKSPEVSTAATPPPATEASAAATPSAGFSPAQALAVDAACSGNPGPMEYRGVHLPSGKEVFHFGPIRGTNNIGEFLAIVHALALMKQKGITMPIYSDSANAMQWVRKRECRTKLERNAKTEEVYRLIERAERWLRANDYRDIPILKWQTKLWGEVPADFGRK